MSGSFERVVEESIGITASALQVWIKSRIGDWPPDRYGRTNPDDASYLVGVLLANWQERFARELGPEGMTLVQEFRHTRNRWAHRVPFELLDAIRGVDTCRRLLQAVKSDRSAELERSLADLLAGSQPTAEPRPTTPPATPVSPAQPRAVVRSAPGGHRRARSAEFRDALWSHRLDDHVAPINRLVDDLIEERHGRWMPYVPHYHGGVHAEIVLLYQDPGPMTATANGGSGFIGCENDDPSASLAADCLDQAGIALDRVLPWNAYPWFIEDQSPLTSAQINEGLDPLRRLLELLPQAHTVVSCGVIAHKSWLRFGLAYPATGRKYRHLETFHTSGRGITNGGRQTKAAGVDHVVATLRTAAI